MHAQTNRPLISVVIPNYDGARFLETCLQSLIRQTYPRVEILVVDNSSRDSSIEIVRRIAPQARILQLESNLGFAAAVNRGVQAASGEWIAVLNNDTEAAPAWLSECAAAISRHPEASFLACRILDFQQRDRIFSAGDCFLRAGIGYRRGQEQADSDQFQQEIPIFAACGCAALYRKTVIEQANGYDEQFFAYLEDVELGLRLQASGMRGYYIPSAIVYHVGSGTSGGEFAPFAVRLRTRNAILLLIKSVPGRILRRTWRMILFGQAFWFGRAIVHGRLLSYLRGWLGVFPILPAMLEQRRRRKQILEEEGERLYQSILESESLARREFGSSASHPSLFLAWYFRLF